MRLFLVFGFLALIISCESIPIKVLSDLPLGDDSLLAAALTRVKKDADSISYPEECAFVQSWQEQPGFINVLSFLDASWEYSHRQATMLKMLQSRLETSGITGIRFFVINSAKPEAAVNIVDIEDEKKAWGAVDPNISEDQAFTVIEKTGEALREKIGSDIAFIQDTEELKIWEKLSASRDQVLVIDQCGRLSYRVIVPWSILHFPYVKAAILSTYKEQPCGVCDIETTTTVSPINETETEDLEELIPKDFNRKQFEEIVVRKYNLDQNDNVAKKIYHGTESQEIPENVIKLLNESAIVKQGNSTDYNVGKTEALEANENSNFYDVEYSPTSNPMENNNDDSDNSTLNYNNETESSTIIDQSTDSVESKTNYSIEDGSSYDTEKSEYRKAESNEFTEETESLGTSNKLGNGFFDDNNSDLENLNTPILPSENQIKISAEDSSENYDYVMPIRIIMHAPHIHEFDEPRNKHEYLVLKLGEPEYHGHLDYDNDFVSVESIESSLAIKNESTTVRSEELEAGESGSGEISPDEDKKKERRDNKKIKAQNDKIVYDKDESPGFYGEDAEYWATFGNAAYEERVQIEVPNEASNISEYIFTTSESSTKQWIDAENTRYENVKINIDSGEQDRERIEEKGFNDNEELQENNTKEEEAANRLLEHYSKLIPWLDYVIDE